jgi:hypothetical protein
MGGDPVDLIHKLRHFNLDLHPVLIGVDAIGGLYSELSEAMQDIMGFSEVSLRCLYKGDRIFDIAFRLVQTTDLRSELLGYGQAGGVVASSIDPQARGELLDIPVHLPVLELEDAAGILRAHVMIDYHLTLLESTLTRPPWPNVLFDTDRNSGVFRA